MRGRYQQYVGWLAVAFSALAGSFWAFWGSIENFHEGWYDTSLLRNLGLMVAQYLSPMLLIVGAGLTGVRWPRLGGGLHAAGALAAAWFLRGTSAGVVYESIVGPLFLLGVLYWVGRPRPLHWAAAVVAGVPLLTTFICGAEPALRVASRGDDGDRGARRITAAGVDLIWAPSGPGWPLEGVTWEEAWRRCRHLTADGTALADTPQDLWRLPTVEEAVRSQARHGRNCGGIWDAAVAQARYQTMPDKEPPLWHPYSKIIYWWTATEADETRAYVVVYNGQVWPRPKTAHWGYLGFRAVRDP
jgi:hypothetical protein